MDIRCPNCRRTFAGPDHLAGKKARCGACKTVFVVPEHAQAGRTCPQCGAPLTAQAILCPRCGMNLETGQAGRRHWEDEHLDVVEEEAPSSAMRAVIFVGEWLPGLFRPRVLILSVFCAVMGFAVLGVCVFFLALGAVLAAFPVGALGLILHAQAVAMLLTGEITMLQEALAELDFNRWLLFVVILSTPFLVIFLILRHVVGR